MAQIRTHLEDYSGRQRKYFDRLGATMSSSNNSTSSEEPGHCGTPSTRSLNIFPESYADIPLGKPSINVWGMSTTQTTLATTSSRTDRGERTTVRLEPAKSRRMDNLPALRTVRPESGLSIIGFILDEYVVTGYFGPAVRTASETWRVLCCSGHACFQLVSRKACDTESLRPSTWIYE